MAQGAFPAAIKSRTAREILRPLRRTQNDRPKLLSARTTTEGMPVSQRGNEVIRWCWTGLADWSGWLLLWTIRRLLNGCWGFGVGRERHVPFTSNFCF